MDEIRNKNYLRNPFITQLMPKYVIFYLLIYFPVSIFLITYYITYPDGYSSFEGSLFLSLLCFLIITTTISYLNHYQEKIKSQEISYNSILISALGLLSSTFLSGAIIPYLTGPFLNMKITYVTIYFISIVTLIIAITGVYGTKNFNEELITEISYFEKKQKIFLQFIWPGTFLFGTVFLVTFIGFYLQSQSEIMGLIAIFGGIGGGITFYFMPLSGYYDNEKKIMTLKQKGRNNGT